MQIRSLAQRLTEELLTRCLLRGKVVFRGKNTEARYLPQDQMQADRKQFTDPRDGEAEYTQPTSPLPSLSPSHWASADYPQFAAPNSAQGQVTCRCKGVWAQRKEERRAGCVCEWGAGWGAGGRFTALKICSNEMRVPGRCWTVTDAKSGILWAMTIYHQHQHYHHHYHHHYHCCYHR